MARTKLKEDTHNRNSTVSEIRDNAIGDADKEMEVMLSDFKFKQEQRKDKVRNHIKNLKSKLPAIVLDMSLGSLRELCEQGYRTYDQVQEHMNNANVLTNITNQTLNSISMSVKKVSRNVDDGYLTGDSVRSDNSKSARQLGPYQSAKAKSRRRSRSVSSVIQKLKKNGRTEPKTEQIMNRDHSRESRSKYRTPNMNRIQSLSIDRCMNPVTPKCEAGRSITMLRYAKQGETVISLQGSPVVGTSVMSNNANLNIPLPDGVLCIQPSNDGTVDPALLSRIDSNTMDQLRQLQENLELIMQCAVNPI